MRLLYLRDVTTLRVKEEACTGCLVCTYVCPRGVLEVRESKVRLVEKDACIECGACALNCAYGALSVRAGVGCAAALLNSRLGRKNACCVADDGHEVCGG